MAADSNVLATEFLDFLLQTLVEALAILAFCIFFMNANTFKVALLQTGLKGLLLVAFLAAYMSTISTQLNFGASFVLNDLYHRFINKTASEKHLVLVSRIITLLLMGIALYATSLIESISAVWKFIFECGAGLGMVLIIRWYWWRINVWSEIAATLTPFIVYAITHFYFKIEFPESYLYTVGITTMSWLVITFLTRPENPLTLQNFYDRVKPDGFWGPVAEELQIVNRQSNIPNLFICWLSAVVMTYSILFLTGKLILLEWTEAGIWTLAALISFLVLKHFINKTGILQ